MLSVSKLDQIKLNYTVSVHVKVPVESQVKPTAVPDPPSNQSHRGTIWFSCCTDAAAFPFITGLWNLTYLLTMYTCKMSVKTNHSCEKKYCIQNDLQWLAETAEREEPGDHRKSLGFKTPGGGIKFKCKLLYLFIQSQLLIIHDTEPRSELSQIQRGLVCHVLGVCFVLFFLSFFFFWISVSLQKYEHRAICWTKLYRSSKNQTTVEFCVTASQFRLLRSL